MSDLADLRADIDRIDDALHDLLMRRAAVVSHVAAHKSAVASRLRPGREAAILRRLLARHHGPLPAGSVVRVWRELLAGSIAMQGPFTLALLAGLEPVAREHFSTLAPLTTHADAAEVLTAVAQGTAPIGVLPLAGDWWANLPPSVAIVARLPFWRPRPPGAPLTEALVIAAAPPDPSGDDCTLAVFTHHIPPQATELARAPAGPYILASLPGFPDAAASGIAQATIVGAYANPLG